MEYPSYGSVPEVDQLLTKQKDDHRLRRAVGGASILSEVANMTKNLIGGGVLSLSNGIALYANDPCAIRSAVYWVTGLGAVFGYFCLV